jgi:3-oxoacyl-[acyl-carrier protein] reductase
MKQKHILIIGGTSGIGKSIAEEQLRLNHRVTIISRGIYPNPFEDLNINLHHADLSQSNVILPEVNIPVDGLVYCPGTINLKPFKMLKDEDFMNDLNVNLLGAVKSFRFYLPRLLESEKASVVLFSTVAVQTGMPYHSSVAAAKGAVEGFGRALAAEFAPRIRVNVIAPSITKTPLASRLLNTDEKIQAAASRHPLNKIGDPEDAASLASFLLSDQSTWITGQILKIDGGMSVIKS